MKAINATSVLGVIGMTIAMSLPAAELQSVKLRDNIAQGYGLIDLMAPHNTSKTAIITGQTLEDFRQQHSNILAVVIDVNEASNGNEKASTQGVAIASASVTFNFSGQEIRCSKYTTNTASMLASSGQNTRVEYPTLIGATGSNLIAPSTSSDLYGSDFSAMLRFSLDVETCGTELPNLSSVTTAFLEIQFVDTNVRLGDPEAFYDFTNGPEDIALISLQDTIVVEAVQAGVEEAPLVIAKSQITTPVDAWFYYPSDNSYYIVSYEDGYPNRGDYDFNDLVVGYRVGLGTIFNTTLKQYEVTSIVATGYIIARGADYTHDWYLRIPINTPVQGTAIKNLFWANSSDQVQGYPKTESISNEINIQLLQDTKRMMSVEGSSFANTLSGQTLIPGKKFSFSVNLETPVLLAEVSAPPYDPYLHVTTTNFEVHLSGFSTQISSAANFGLDTAFRDNNGFPYALVFPDNWYPPLEGTDLGEAYKDFINYSTNPNPSNETWYLSPTNTAVKTISKSFWGW